MGPSSPSRLPGAAGEGAELPSRGGAFWGGQGRVPGTRGGRSSRVGSGGLPGAEGVEEFLGQPGGRGKERVPGAGGIGGALRGGGTSSRDSRAVGGRLG